MLYSVLSIMLSLSLSTAHAGKVKERNWKEHPEIMAIRRLKKRVLDGQKLPGWSTASENIVWCEENRLSKKSKVVDDKDVIRKYSTEGAHGSTAFWTESVYGPKGTLRWVFVRLFQADSETSEEYKVFFDSEGTQIWSRYKQTPAGESDTDKLLPEHWFIKDPSATWQTPSQCDQDKPGSSTQPD
ncbi:MAG: hypothetical protein ACPGTU_02975 [Myxococcota bacterium]